MDVVWLAIVLGLTGSLHCVGMCGPIALALPLNTENSVSRAIGALSYNFGRIATYSTIGILFGFFGKGFKLAGILQIISIVIGSLILVSVIVPKVLKKINFTGLYYLRFNSWVKQKIGSRFSKKSNMSLFILGLLNGMLPCGLVFVAIGSSLAFGGVLEGALFMLFFGLGTMPIMFLLPFFSGSISIAVKAKMRKAVPFVMVLFGILFILRGLNLDIPFVSPPIDATGTEVKSCCH